MDNSEPFILDDVISILLPVEKIPDKATVTKRNGDSELTLSHSLKVYRSAEKLEPLVIGGYFLHGPRGSLNQVLPGTIMVWRVQAADLLDYLQMAAEGVSQ